MIACACLACIFLSHKSTCASVSACHSYMCINTPNTLVKKKRKVQTKKKTKKIESKHSSPKKQELTMSQVTFWHHFRPARHRLEVVPPNTLYRVVSW